MIPDWLKYARTLKGTREIPGAKHSPTIMGWIKGLGAKVLGVGVTNDETPWCGTYVAHVLVKSGLGTLGRESNRPIVAVRAKAWLEWGRVLVGPRPGCVMVFDRKGGGHVGFYEGEDATHYHILGGNQGNAVNVMRLDKVRCVGMRWPFGPKLGPVEHVKLAGGVVSGDET